MTTTSTFEAALAPYRLLTHPFYRRWEAGELREGELARYAGQYRHFEEAFPGILSDVMSMLPAGPARDLIAQNLRDEVATPSHVTLFDGFSSHYGANADAATPATVALLDAYRDAMAKGAAAGVAGVLAYEMQGEEIASSKADGLRAHYGATDDACAFWDVHSALEESHAQWTNEALRDLDGDALAGFTTVATAWWQWLDEREAEGLALAA